VTIKELIRELAIYQQQYGPNHEVICVSETIGGSVPVLCVSYEEGTQFAQGCDPGVVQIEIG
jgi:hypothetical protein